LRAKQGPSAAGRSGSRSPRSSVPTGGGARGESRRLAGGPRSDRREKRARRLTGTGTGTVALLSHRDQGAAGPPRPPPPCPTAQRRRALVPCQGARSNCRAHGRCDRHIAGGLTFLQQDSFSLFVSKMRFCRRGSRVLLEAVLRFGNLAYKDTIFTFFSHVLF
jgi:hypothetical protein